MADFKTTLNRLAQGEVDFDSVAQNLEKLIQRQPRAAVSVLDQMKEAVQEDIIDAETYARLKARISSYVEAVPIGHGADERTRFAGDGDGDATQFAGGGDATRFASDDEDAATQVMADVHAAMKAGEADDIFDITGTPERPVGDAGDATEILDITSGATITGGSAITAGIDFDIAGTTGPDTASSWPTGGSQTGQTGTDWSHPGGGHAPTKVAVGEKLRGRFRLEKKIGEGGMGSVFLGVDEIKEKARDRRSKVALKVLNENFKEHPDAFISLQREASRQQRLAHPNIATVYDFDQTDDGLAFLVMEFMDGQPLDKFIKTDVKQRGGLPFSEALPMVQGLGAALIYAHERNLVHSDFKPGNCFLLKHEKKEKDTHGDVEDTTDGKEHAEQTQPGYQAHQMKVLDFGIARAVKNPNLGEGEQTIFDPGKLGALTPAYASLEMLEGEEPDPRDDIYALACVAYELLTGKHPFNKKAANRAKEMGLVPEPVKGLTRKQWRGLERGLAFTREKRSQTCEQFLEEFEGKTTPWKNPFIVVPAAAALIAAVSVAPVMNYFDERDTGVRIALANSGDPKNIEQVLGGLDDPKVDGEKRDRVLTNAKESILTYFDAIARGKIDIASGHLDFTGARETLAKANSYAVYKDSTVLKALDEYIKDSENRVLAEQFDKFNAALEAGRLLPSDADGNIHDAMAVVAKIDAKHPMLHDRRLPGAFAVAINQALENKQFDYADNLSHTGLELIGKENKLIVDLVDKIGGAKERAETAGKLLAAIDAVQKALDSNEGLAALYKVRKEIVDLARLDPGNELLDKVRKSAEPRAAKDLAALESSHNWGASQLMLGDYSQMLRALGLHDMNTRVAALADQLGQQLVKLRNDSTQAVAAGKLAPEGAGLVQQMATLAPHHDITQQARDQLALAHLQAARTARDAGDFAASGGALATARQQTPSARVASLLDGEAKLAAEVQGQDTQARASGLEARKAAFASGLGAFESLLGGLGADPAAYAPAFAKYQELASQAPGDPRLTEAGNKLAAAVEQNAGKIMQAGRWDDAVDLARDALVDLPRASGLASRLDGLEGERKVAIAENEKKQVADAKQALAKLLEQPTADRTWRASVRQHMGNIAAFGDPKDPWLKETSTHIAAALVERATTMRSESRFAEGANLLTDAERYAADAPGLAEERKALKAATEEFEREQAEQARLARIDGLKETFESQTKAGDVANAAKTFDSLKKEVGATPDTFVTTEGPRLLAGAYYKLATQQAKNDSAAALKFAKACAELQPQRQECKIAVRDYTVSGNKQELDKTLPKPEFDIAEALGKMSEVQTLDPGVFSQSEGAWAQALANRFNAMKQAGVADAKEANNLLKQAKDAFPGNQMLAAIEPFRLGAAGGSAGTAAPSKLAPKIKEAMDKALLSQAKELLLKASQTEGENAEIVQLKGSFNGRVKQVKDIVTSFDGRLNEGSSLVAAWQADRSDATKNKANTVLVAARDELKGALAIWSDSEALQKRKRSLEDELAKLTGEIVEPPPPPPTTPCETKLAGYGKRKAGTCFYFVSTKAPGPYMVVVPAGEGVAKPFAIGKFEVTVGDFNRYCKSSGKCAVNSTDSADLPVAGVSLAQAQEYTAWLSKRTGQTFRLPTREEWLYAANAAGDQPKKDYNCRVEQGGQVLKGQGTMGVNTGKANGWGLYNYVGNVQEWATNGNGVVAMGGAFEDSFSKCDIGLEKQHAGSADKATGFRVVLDLGS